jgi:hypothetical protein
MKKAALKCVGYFNGTPVYSDKILVGDIVCTPRGARLTFKGGSTCDTGTGSITIKGSATIRIGDDKGQREEQPSEAQEQLPTPDTVGFWGRLLALWKTLGLAVWSAKFFHFRLRG